MNKSRHQISSAYKRNGKENTAWNKNKKEKQIEENCDDEEE